jgi:hypothetical protein
MPPAYTLTVSIRRDNAPDTLGSIDLSIPIQGNLDAISTQFWSVVSDHIVAIWIAFIPICASLIAGYLSLQSNEWRRSIEEMRKRIQLLRKFRYEESLKFVKELEEIESLLANARQQSGHPLRDPEVVQAWQEARQELIEPEFGIFLFVKKLNEIESLLTNARQKSGYPLQAPEVVQAWQVVRQQLLEPEFGISKKVSWTEGKIVILVPKNKTTC